MRNGSEEFLRRPISLTTPYGLPKSLLTVAGSSLVQRFLLVGGSNAVIGSVLIYSLLFAGLGAESANFIGYAIMIPLSYVAHARISFQRREIKVISFWKYLLAVFISFSLNFAVLVALTRFSSISRYLAQIPAFAVYGLVFFSLNRLFVFAERPA
jgi:putative flippase GtrA